MSSRHLADVRVHSLPQDVDERELAERVVIVVDILRATTTICCALAAGAPEVVPFRTIAETLAAAEKAGRRNVVLGGERGGRPIEGFDLGNSPREYTAETVRGRPVYITTTNGTQALYHARLAKRVVVGAVVNLSAVVASVRDEPEVDILCAGTDGQWTGEDILAAGGIVRGLNEYAKGREKLNDRAVEAANHWRMLQNGAIASGTPMNEALSSWLRECRGGQNLIEVRLESDLADCAQIDRLSIVPELDVHGWRIVAGSS
jgi:2-phosphosulfolactate phosphatase